MSQEERTGERDLTYSRWHRRDSTSRYMPVWAAKRLTYIDLDGIEVCWHCGDILALIETAVDQGNSDKATTIMRRLAERAKVPSYLVYYQKSRSGDDVTRIRTRRVSPTYSPWRSMRPSEWAAFLVRLREDCHSMGLPADHCYEPPAVVEGPPVLTLGLLA